MGPPQLEPESSLLCGHCDKPAPTNGVGHECCGYCKAQEYCSAECMQAHSSEHEPKCKADRLLDLMSTIHTVEFARDWRKVIPLQAKMEMLMLDGPIDVTNDQRRAILNLFIHSNNLANAETGHYMYKTSALRLKESIVKLLGDMGLFHDQALEMTSLGGMFMCMKQIKVANVYFQEVRDIGEAHGFFTLECKGCLGLGRVAMKEGRVEEGLALLRNALVASSLLIPSDLPHTYEMNALYWLIDALFDTDALDEAETMIMRMAALVQEEALDYIQVNDMRVVIDKARLHQARGQYKEAEDEMRTLLETVRKDAVHVCRWRAEFQNGIKGARTMLKHVWNKNLDKSLADVNRLL
jgi:tetratricopeptide (TPR) repeat protein